MDWTGHGRDGSWAGLVVASRRALAGQAQTPRGRHREPKVHAPRDPRQGARPRSAAGTGRPVSLSPRTAGSSSGGQEP